ncbi:hypothetical protein ACG7TL_001771 [Trametes sanguinea]
MSRKTVRTSKRTSTEAAASAQQHVAFTGTSEVLEANGELSSPYSLPPPEPEPKGPKRTRRTPKNPIAAAATESALSAKWGMAEHERLAEIGGFRRVTRTYAHAARSGVPRTEERLPERGTPVLFDGSLSGSTPTAADSKPLDLKVQDRPESRPNTEELRPEEGSASRMESRQTGSTPGPTQSRRDGSTGDRWTQVSGSKNGMLSARPALPIGRTQCLSWLDLCEAEDQLGDIPGQWAVRPHFWQEVASSASDTEDEDLNMAIQASLQTFTAERQSDKGVLHAMAVIVKVQPNEEPSKPAGRDGRFTAEQKGKSVASERSQREFLAQFVAHTPEPEPRRRSHRPRVKQEASAEGRVPGPSQTRPKTATPFQRDSSQIPDGGWFRATTEAGDRGGRDPPSSSSTSSSSDDDSEGSDSTSDSEMSTTGSSSESCSSESDTRPEKSRKSVHAKRHRKRQKDDCKAMRKALSGVKIKTPFVWDGTADLDVFDQWTYEIDTWAELNDLADRVVVKLMIQFMKGEASRFFMRHVATRQADWTVKRLYEALFDYCFPTDYKARLCARLERSVQGRSRVRDFVRDLQQLAVRFPDVTDFQLVQIFWKGMNTYLRVYLIEKGLNPEKTPLDKLVKYAVRKEEAYTEARREERAFSGQVPGRSWGRFGTRSEGPEPYQGEKSRGAREPIKPNQRDTRRHQSDSRKDRYNAPKGPRREGERTATMSREERDRLRAEGRCFTCKETGHQSSNCPTRKTAKAPRIPGLQAGAVNFEDLEQLAEKVRRSNDSPLFVGCMSLPSERTETSMPRERQEGIGARSDCSNDRIWSRAHPEDCIQYLQALFQSYHEFELSEWQGLDAGDNQRYAVDVYGGQDEFLVTDRLAAVGMPDKYVVTRGDLDDPDWDVSVAIQRTPFIFQHRIALGMNPSRVHVGSNAPLRIEGDEVAEILSASAELLEQKLEDLRKTLREEAADLCQDGATAKLPPLRAINHTIPLIDEAKIYPWRPSKCPDALKPLWQEKKNAYLQSGRWQMASGTNASPMLMIPKPDRHDGILRLRTVVDKRAQNANTHKMAAPLPDMDGILRNVVSHKYRSIIDGKDAYEQIRVVPEHIDRTLFTTPDGTMVSLVLQQGDINGPMTYQMVMNHIFAPYIGVFMDVYLDDIVIYSDTIEEHMKHIQIVLDVLRREKFYLGADKMNFFALHMKILGHVIDEHGIRMDPHKVDAVRNWKVPTNKSLLSSFLGAVSFLAPDCEGIRIPMGVLAPLTSATKIWKWNGTHQRAFDQVKEKVHLWRNNRRIALDFSPGAPQINLVTDASLTGASGYISQGDDLPTSRVVVFWSGKFNPAQQHYPVHEQELLAIVESLKRFRPLLYGASFRICTDHKALEYLMSQKHLSPRQHRWMDVLNEFRFTIHYIPGETNTLADALSRIYSDEPAGTERAESEYVGEDGAGVPHLRAIYTGAAAVVDFSPRRSAHLASKPIPEGTYRSLHNGRPSRTTLSSELNAPVVNNGADHSLVEETAASGGGDHIHEPTLEESAQTMPSQAARDVQGHQSLITSAGELGVPLPEGLRGRYTDDPYFRRILKCPDEFPQFALIDGLLYKDEEGTTFLCIPDVMFGTRRIREVILRHAHSILAHLGHEKTLAYLRGEVWWPEMASDVATYCQTCGVCATTKSQTTKPLGLLKPLPVPRRPWQYIAMDFVGPLPESSNRNGSFDMICVIIDQLTSMVHLVPTKQTYGAREMAELVFDHVYKLHGLPEQIISDRDTLFTSTFWCKLHDLLGTELRLSSAYHPQTDGVTERANRTMTQMLRQCVQPDQKDWVIKLPAVELAMNMARSESTGFSPFYLNYGQMPRSLVWSSETEYPGIEEFARRMKTAIMAAHDAIIGARASQVVQANKRRRKAAFAIDDLVYLSTKNLNLPKGRARKLSPKYLGPFRISEIIREGATYRIDLPRELKARGIHDAFHASLLRPHYPNDDRRFPGRQFHQLPGFGEQPREWAVDRVLSHVGKGADAKFEVQWTTGDVTWAPFSDVKHLQVLAEYFEALGVSTIRQLPNRAPDNRSTADDVRRTNPLAEEPMLSVAAVSFSEGGPMVFRNGLGWEYSSTATQTVSITNEHNGERPATRSTRPCSLSTMSSNPQSYNTEDRVRWERYADAFRNWLAKRGPYPGDLPAGYLEVYKTIQRYAPCPHEFAALVAAELRPTQPVPNVSSSSGVSMSSDAFAAMLAHQSAAQQQMAELVQQVGHGSGQRGYSFRGRGHGHGQYAPRGIGGRHDRGHAASRREHTLSDRIGRRNDTQPNHIQRPTRRGRRAPRTQPQSPQPNVETGSRTEENLPDDGMTCYHKFLRDLLTVLSAVEADHGVPAEANSDRDESVPREVLQAELPFADEAAEELPMAVDYEDREWAVEY